MLADVGDCRRPGGPGGPARKLPPRPRPERRRSSAPARVPLAAGQSRSRNRSCPRPATWTLRSRRCSWPWAAAYSRRTTWSWPRNSPGPWAVRCAPRGRSWTRAGCRHAAGGQVGHDGQAETVSRPGNQRPPEHQEGMKGAELIIAVNTDPKATDLRCRPLRRGGRCAGLVAGADRGHQSQERVGHARSTFGRSCGTCRSGRKSRCTC